MTLLRPHFLTRELFAVPPHLQSKDTIGIPAGTEERIKAEKPHVLASMALDLESLPEAGYVEGWQQLTPHTNRCREAEVFIRYLSSAPPLLLSSKDTGVVLHHCV